MENTANLPQTVARSTVARSIDQWTKDVMRSFGVPLTPRDLIVHETDGAEQCAEAFLTAALTQGSVTVVSLDGTRTKHVPNAPVLDSNGDASFSIKFTFGTGSGA